MNLYPVEPLGILNNPKDGPIHPPHGPLETWPRRVCLRKAGTLWLGRHYKIYGFPVFLSMIILCDITKKDPSTKSETFR